MKVKLPFEPSSVSQEAAIAALDDSKHLYETIKLNNDSEEIETCFRVPISFLLQDKRHRNDNIQRNGESFFMPAYKFESFIIWGLTALMTVDFLNITLDAGIDLKTEGNR